MRRVRPIDESDDTEEESRIARRTRSKALFNVDAALASQTSFYRDLVRETQLHVLSYLDRDSLRSFRETSKAGLELVCANLIESVRAEWRAFKQRREDWRGNGLLNMEIISELASKYFVTSATMRAILPVDEHYTVPLADVLAFFYDERIDLFSLNFFDGMKWDLGELEKQAPTWFYFDQNRQPMVALDKYLAEYLESAAAFVTPTQGLGQLEEVVANHFHVALLVLEALNTDQQSPLYERVDYWRLAPWLVFDGQAQYGVLQVLRSVATSWAQRLTTLPNGASVDEMNNELSRSALLLYLYPQNEAVAGRALGEALGMLPDSGARVNKCKDFYQWFKQRCDTQYAHKLPFVVARDLPPFAWTMMHATHGRIDVLNMGFNFLAFFWPQRVDLVRTLSYFSGALRAPLLNELNLPATLNGELFGACVFDFRAELDLQLQFPMLVDHQHHRRRFIYAMESEALAEWMIAFSPENCKPGSPLYTAILLPLAEKFVRGYRSLVPGRLASQAQRTTYLIRTAEVYPFYVVERLVAWIQEHVPTWDEDELDLMRFKMEQNMGAYLDHIYYGAEESYKRGVNLTLVRPTLAKLIERYRRGEAMINKSADMSDARFMRRMDRGVKKQQKRDTEEKNED